MRINEIISTSVNEDISRRNFVRGLGAAAITPTLAKAGTEPDEEDVYWGARKDYTEAPRKLYPNIAVDKPDQYAKQLDVVIYSGAVYNKMNYQDFIKLKTNPNPNTDSETLAANAIPGVTEKIILSQIGNYNYFVTQSMAEKFVKQYQTEQLSKRGRDIKQRMARGDWSGDNISPKKLPPGNKFDPTSIREPKFSWEIDQNRDV